MKVYDDNSDTVNGPSGFREEDWNVNSLVSHNEKEAIDDRLMKSTHDPDIQAKLKITLRWLMGFK